MSARSRSAAVRSYQHRLQQVLSCVTAAVPITVDMSRNRNTLPQSAFGIALPEGRPVPLQAETGVLFWMSQGLRVDIGSESGRNSWQITQTAYSYMFRTFDDTEICSYQWHPGGRSPVVYPHLHIGRGATGNVTTFGPRGLHRIHFPTKHIELEDVLRLAITEFGVEPRRTDWEQILGNASA